MKRKWPSYERLTPDQARPLWHWGERDTLAWAIEMRRALRWLSRQQDALLALLRGGGR